MIYALVFTCGFAIGVAAEIGRQWIKSLMAMANFDSNDYADW